MDFITSQIAAITPWALGYVAIYIIAPAFLSHDLGMKCIMIGASLIIGYLSLAGQIWLLDLIGVNPFSPYLFLTTGAFLLFCYGIKHIAGHMGYIEVTAISYGKWNYKSIFILLVAVLLILFVAHLNYQVAMVANVLWK